LLINALTKGQEVYMIHDVCRRLNRRRNENHFHVRKVSSQLGIVGRKCALGYHKSVRSQNPSCERRIQRRTFHCCCPDRYLHYTHVRSTVHRIDFAVSVWSNGKYSTRM